jgi:hypothetical protein
VNLTATIEATGANTTGIRVPEELLEELGQGRRPKVQVVFPNGYVHRTTVGPHAGGAYVSVSAAVRDAAQVAAGDVVDLELTLDTAPREVEVPDDLAAALAADAAARSFFGGLTDSQRKAFVTSVTSAKKPETRQRRVAGALEALAAGRKRP